VLVAAGDAITAGDLGLGAGHADRRRPTPAPARAFEAEPVPAPRATDGPASESERASIEEALIRAGGVVAKAAAEMGVSRQALYRRMERLGVVLERRPR